MDILTKIASLYNECKNENVTEDDLYEFTHEFIENQVIYYRQQIDIISAALGHEKIDVSSIDEMIEECQTMAALAYRLLEYYLIEVIGS